jgi:hypothetical protein
MNVDESAGFWILRFTWINRVHCRRTAMQSAKFLSVLALSIALLGMTTGASRAATFDFTSDHCSGGCGTPPFGTVTLTQNGSNVDFVVFLGSGENWAQTGAADFQLFKFNGVPLGSSILVTTQSFPSQTLIADTGVFNGDGTGDFEFGITCSTCGNGNLGISNSLFFEVTNTTIAALTVPNSLGIIFVADIFGTIGTALVGLGVLGRRRRSKRAGITGIGQCL